MGSGENSDQLALALQRDGDLGTRIRLASHVVRVASDVGRIVHFASGRDVPHHSVAWLEVMALAVNGAASNPGQYESRLLRVAQVEVDFDAAERRRNFVYDSRNEFFNVKSGRDALREFLHAHQFCDPVCGRFGHWLGGKAEIRERTGGHDETLLPDDCNWSLILSHKIARIRSQILFLFGFLLDLMSGWTPAA